MNNFKIRKALGPDLPVMVNLFANFPVILMTFFLMASCSKDDEIPSPINDTYLSIPDLSCIKIQSNQEIPTLSLSEYQQVNELCD